MALDGNVVYNWEGGKIHPYVTGGLGFYHFRYTESNINTTDSHFGGDSGGGAEYFFTRHDTITAEVLAHIIEGPAQSALATYRATYWTLTFGYRGIFAFRPPAVRPAGNRGAEAPRLLARSQEPPAFRPAGN